MKIAFRGRARGLRAANQEPWSLLLPTRGLIERFSYANCREQPHPQPALRSPQIVAALIFIAVISYKYRQSETEIWTG